MSYPGYRKIVRRFLGNLEVTSNLCGAICILVAFFFKKIKVRHLRYNFSKKSKENIKMHASY